MRLRNLFLNCRDLDRSRQFYLQGLNLALLRTSPNLAVVDLGGCELHLHQLTPEQQSQFGLDADPGSNLGLSLAVADLDQACERLARLGVAPAFGPAPAPWGERVALVRDPDEITLELAQAESN